MLNCIFLGENFLTHRNRPQNGSFSGKMGSKYQHLLLRPQKERHILGWKHVIWTANYYSITCNFDEVTPAQFITTIKFVVLTQRLRLSKMILE